MVTCFAGELKRTFLNLIVNATDAVREAVGQSGGQGLVTVVTRRGRRPRSQYFRQWLRRTRGECR